MKSGEPEWSVRELAELAATTVRTIHYYISEGLLPPPSGSTRNATYSDAHLARLQLIAALREEGLALASIRQRIAPLTDQQVQALIGDLDAHLAHPGDGGLTTLGLIETALATQGDDAGFQGVYSVYEERQQKLGPAADYLEQLRREPRPVAPAPRLQSPPKKPKVPAGRLKETWHSYYIDDGIELRIRDDRDIEARGRIRAVIDALQAAVSRYGIARPDNTDRE